MNIELIKSVLETGNKEDVISAKEYLIRHNDKSFVERLNKSLEFANKYKIQENKNYSD
jgi:LPS O-antigen subunit length determinant protein (WzzB/FepE family)